MSKETATIVVFAILILALVVSIPVLSTNINDVQEDANMTDPQVNSTFSNLKTISNNAFSLASPFPYMIFGAMLVISVSLMLQGVGF